MRIMPKIQFGSSFNYFSYYQVLYTFFFLGNFWLLLKIFRLKRLETKCKTKCSPTSRYLIIKKGVYTKESSLRLMLLLIHMCYTSIIFLCRLKEIFQKLIKWILCFFSCSYYLYSYYLYLCSHYFILLFK